MKNLFLPMALLLLAAGCASSQDTRLSRDPRGYEEAMDKLAFEIRNIDKHVIGAQYALAVPECERALSYATALVRHDPARIGNVYDEYSEYQAQADDMRRAVDRLLFLVQQRRRDEVRQQLENVARRYNYMSSRYGPGYQLSVLERDPRQLARPEFYRGELPGELRSR
ncbi:MAG: hypothetical protein HS108_02180 [Planctomycetes bacterium]|jgi:hypothetical protein|nr:hypothetical protein [Planctomycetota bacterium]MCL4729993.1 hypothetical protein [Planctomycetota bacterium]